MILVFFGYGLSFFLLGAAIGFQKRKGSDFRIGKYLWLLAGFGLLHGLNEWMDMFLLLGSSHWGLAGIMVIKIMRLVVGYVSYIFLLQFGLTVLIDKPSVHWSKPVLTIVPGAYITLMLVMFGWGLRTHFSPEWFLMTDVTMRYGLALPGSLLAAAAFHSQRKSRDIADLHSARVMQGITGLTLFFALYAILAGAIVKDAGFFPSVVFNYSAFMRLTGLPVQVFRAVCAVGILVCLCRVLSIFDIETRKRLEMAYREIMSISNREQMRIGQDLHDSLCQQLVGIACMSKAIERKLERGGVAEMADVRQITEFLDQSVELTRSLSRGLYPVEIEKNGFVAALSDLANSVEAMSGIPCVSTLDETIEVRDIELATHLYRIAQEAMNNAARHGRASSLALDLTRFDGRLVLTIEDDGIGLPDPPRVHGMGLSTMRYRAEVIGAEIIIGRRQHGGTVVRCTVREKKNIREP